MIVDEVHNGRGDLFDGGLDFRGDGRFGSGGLRLLELLGLLTGEQRRGQSERYNIWDTDKHFDVYLKRGAFTKILSYIRTSLSTRIVMQIWGDICISMSFTFIINIILKCFK